MGIRKTRKNGPIIAFGDSLVEGIGASTGKDWVSILSVRHKISIINKGKSNDTTRSARARIEEDVLCSQPRLVILLLGGNDVLMRIPKRETFDNFDDMIDRIHDQNSEVLLLGVRGGIILNAFEGHFEALAQNKEVSLVPNILEGILGDEALMTDPFHPNDKGYQLLADRIDTVLKRLIS